MASVTELPAVADRLDWTVDAGDPDFFGDVRIAAYNGFGDTVRMTFANTGKLAGAYLYPRRGNIRHTEKDRDVESWLANMNGEFEE